MDKGTEDGLRGVLDSAQELKRVVENLVAYLKGQVDAGRALRMWVDDAKACFEALYRSVCFLAMAVDTEPRRATEAERALGTATHHLEACRSELMSIQDAGAKEQEARLATSFAECRTRIETLLRPLRAPADAEHPPEKDVQAVQKEIDGRKHKTFSLLCGRCGTTAEAFDLVFAKAPKTTDAVAIVFQERELPSWMMPHAIPLLECRDFAGLHKLLQRPHGDHGRPWDEQGISRYCPECDKVYCERHWDIRHVYDGGFYDYSNGTCPEGHTREVND